MRKILLVEDEPVLRESYEMILSTEPYTVHTAADGSEALRLCLTTDYDLILLDLMMPHVDGVMFLERYLKANKHLPKTIVLSNLSSGDALAKAMALGAHRHAVKADLSPRQLLSLVRYELEST